MSETRRPNDIDGEEGASRAFSRRAMLLGGTALAASTMGAAPGAQVSIGV